MISEFKGEYRWLSNFWTSPVVLDGVTYPSVENAYQAAKTLTHSQRAPFTRLSSDQAKYAGKKVQMRADWNQVKLAVMKDLVRQKFQIPELKTKLLATKGQQLVEGNYWNDTFWGVCRGVGQNHLGKIIMEVRDSMTEETVGKEYKPYAGIGSRETPEHILRVMAELGAAYEFKGLTLRSGGAEGADSAFELHVTPANKEIYLARGKRRLAAMPESSSELWWKAEQMVRPYAPHFDRMSPYVQDLFRRNMFQIMGADLTVPSRFVVYWAPERNGVVQGGTRMAVYAARALDIATENLADPAVLARCQDFLARWRRGE